MLKVNPIGERVPALWRMFLKNVPVLQMATSGWFAASDLTRFASHASNSDNGSAVLLLLSPEVCPVGLDNYGWTPVESWHSPRQRYAAERLIAGFCPLDGEYLHFTTNPLLFDACVTGLSVGVNYRYVEIDPEVWRAP